MKKTYKPKKCKNCLNMFTPIKALACVCSVKCAIQHDRNLKAKKKLRDEQKALRVKRDKLKPKSKWLSEAQSVFNKYIRERDILLPCISCGRHHTGQYHAGHYRTVKACPQLRFNTYNVHKQCSACNNHLSGNITEYRLNLIEKIGVKKLEQLECDNGTKNIDIEYCKRIKAIFTKRTKLLIKRRIEWI